MISFVTNYDEATCCNHKVYINCDLTPNIPLLSDDATAGNLVSALAQTSSNVFAMSHGDDEKLCDQDGNDTFTINNLATLTNGTSFNVFAYACNTSKVLGQIAAQNNIKWFGFVEPINPPETDESLKDVYVEIFNYIYVEFPLVSCEDSANTFLDGLKSLCDAKSLVIDNTILLNGDSPRISSYISVKQMWEKQKIWLSKNISVVHPDAPAPIIW